MRISTKKMAACLLTLSLACSLAVGETAFAASDMQQSRTETALAAAPKATWIVQGQGRHVLYVFFDPNCPYCSRLYKDLQPLIAPRDLQLRWIPVAILAVTSLGKAAAILQAKDPKAMLDASEGHSDTAGTSSSFAEDIPSEDTEARLRANAALLKQVGMGALPSMLFQAKSGEAVAIPGGLSAEALRKMVDRIR